MRSNSMVNADELSLIKRIKKGDDEAFNILMQGYSSTIYNIGLRMLSNREDAADLTQDVMIKIYRNIGSFRGDAAFSTWVYRISVNCCRDALRSICRRREIAFAGFGEGDDEMQPVMNVADYSMMPEEIYEAGEEKRYLYSLIGGLAPAYRMVFVMREIGGLSYQEIAAAANISIGTVKSRLSRARTAMLEQLKKDAEHYPQLRRLMGKGGSEDGM